jgi:hypothetical protein
VSAGRHIARPREPRTLCKEPAPPGAFRWAPGAPFFERIARDPEAAGLALADFCFPCVEAHQEYEHLRLAHLITARLRFFGRTGSWLGKQVIERWQTSCEWELLSLDYKQRVLDEIEGWVNNEARGVAA